MSDRLQELLRQKALLQEHSAWLDREIAAEMGRTPPAPSPAPEPASAARTAAPSTAEADAILDQYRGSAQSIHQQVKRGCLLYLAVAFALVAASVIAIHLLSRRG